MLIGSNQITFTNTSINANTYNWDFGDGNSSTLQHPMHQYTNAGTYNVRLIASNCFKKDTIIQTVNVIATAISNSINQSLTWTLYPNPASTDLCLNINYFGKLDFSIYNYTGTEVLNGSPGSPGNKVDITSLSKGIYFIQLIGKDKTFRRLKFVKQ
jgi:PKD repeat protein